MISDGDIRVPVGYLERVTAPLADPRVGLVTCAYSARAETWPARFEALGVATDFGPSTMVAPFVGIDEFGLGSTLVVRARDLERIGGFAALSDYLADDYQLGRRIHALGLRCVLSDVMVETHLPGDSWGEVWRHQVRWARTIRVSRAGGYAGLPIANATVWALLAAVTGRWPIASGTDDAAIPDGLCRRVARAAQRRHAPALVADSHSRFVGHGRLGYRALRRYRGVGRRAPAFDTGRENCAMRFVWSLVLCGALVPAAVPETPRDRITPLFDAHAAAPLVEGWGYSAFVEYRGKRILFDAGPNADVLAKNSKALGIDLTKLDAVVISHDDPDHYGGLDFIYSVNPGVKVYVPESESGAFSTSVMVHFFRFVHSALPGQHIVDPPSRAITFVCPATCNSFPEYAWYPCRSMETAGVNRPCC